MMRLTRGSSRTQRNSTRTHRAQPRLEGLEDRRLLYATLGASWTAPIRITYSFVPDGSSIGGTPSSLFQTLNAKFSTETWQREFQTAAAIWQAVANVNLVQVNDAGGALDTYGYQQGDPRFGDIRISAAPLPFGTMAAAFSPPPINGGTAAGDIVMNSTMDWKINSNWDLRTVAIHEFGHALGMGHAAISAATMWSYYIGVKQFLNADDIAGIRSIYDARQPDGWNSNGQSNVFWYQARGLDGRLTAQNQIQIQWVNLHQTGMTEWFWVTIPQVNSGKLDVRMQSANFSSLSPRLEIYDFNLNYKGGATSSKFGDTITATINGVTAGQGFLVRAGSGSGGSTGYFGLQFNFGTNPLPALVPANPVVPWQPNQGGGSSSLELGDEYGDEHGDAFESHVELVRIGDVEAWGDTLLAPGGGHSPEYLAALGAANVSKVDGSRLQGLKFPPAFASAMRTDPTDAPAATAPGRLVRVAPTAKPGGTLQVRTRETPAADRERPTPGMNRAWTRWATTAGHQRPMGGAMRSVGSLGGL